MLFSSQKGSKVVSRIIVFMMLIGFSLNVVMPSSHAQVVAQSFLSIPEPGTLVTTSESFNPPLMAGITIHPQNPFKIDFMISTGDDDLKGDIFKAEAQKLINYFFATLTVPDDEMWVNLSPYEKDRIIADGLGKTEMGRDMLIQDYMLKQVTASLMYPEEELGDKFWKKIYKKAKAKFGTTDIPTNVFNKVWIVPQKAVVYINGTNVLVSESYLKVMLEQDYLALENNRHHTSHGVGDVALDKRDDMSDETKAIIREVIIPEIEREVNQGSNFANLRQIYHSMILATWYKKNLNQSMLAKVYMNQNKVNNIDLEDDLIKDKIYKQYVSAFEKGVYDYVKEGYDPLKQQVTGHKYFSGGLTNQKEVIQGDLAMTSLWQQAQVGEIKIDKVLMDASPIGEDGHQIEIARPNSDLAMTAIDEIDSKIAALQQAILQYKSSIRWSSLRLEIERYGSLIDMANAEIDLLMKERVAIESDVSQNTGAPLKDLESEEGINEEIKKLNAELLELALDRRKIQMDHLQDKSKLQSKAIINRIEKLQESLKNFKTNKDHAMTAQQEDLINGGIDFNPAAMDLQANGELSSFSFDDAAIKAISPDAVNGILPVIINITPITNFAPLLGSALDVGPYPTKNEAYQS